MSDFKYNAFISYRHMTEYDLAAALRIAVKKFAKPWGKKSLIRIYRDTSSQNMTADLFRDVKFAMNESEFFILMASPGSKESKWVNREVQHWVKTKTAKNLLLVLCDGSIEWDNETKDFNWEKTNCLPWCLSGQYKDNEGAPLYLDLSEVRKSENLTLKNKTFKSKVAQLAATLRKIKLDEMYGEEVDQLRRTQRIKISAVTIFFALLSFAAIAGWNAYQKAMEARMNEALKHWGTGVQMRDRLNQPVRAAHWFAMASKGPDPGLRDDAILAAIHAVKGSKLVWNKRSFADLGASLGTGDAGFLSWYGKKGAGNLLQWNADGSNDLPGRPFEGSIIAAHGTDKVLVSINNRECNQLKIWNLTDDVAGPNATCIQQGSALNHEHRILGARFGPTGGRVVSWASDESLHLWDADKNKPIKNWPVKAGDDRDNLSCTREETPPDDPLSRKKTVRGAQFSSSGNLIVSWHDDYSIKVWDVSTGRQIAGPPCNSLRHKKQIQGALIEDGDERILSWGQDSAIRVWELNTGKVIFERHHDDVITGATFNASGSLVLSWGDDRTVRIWDLGGGIERIFRHEGQLEGAAFSTPGEAFVLSWGSDNTVRLWDVDGGIGSHPPLHHESPVRDAVLDCETGYVITRTDDGNLRRWDLSQSPNREERQSFCEPFRPGQPSEEVKGARFSRDGRMVVSWAAKEAVVWTTRTGTVRKFSHPDYITKAGFNPSGTRLLIAGEDGQLRVWDVTGIPEKDPKEVPIEHFEHGTFPGQYDTRFISWDREEEGTVFAWGVSGDRVFDAQPFQYDGTVEKAIFHRDRDLILGWDNGGDLRLWDIPAQKLSRLLQPVSVDADVIGADFDSTGTRALSWYPDGSIQLWDVSDSANPGQLNLIRTGSRPRTVAFNEDGTRVLVSNINGTVMLWDSDENELLKTYIHKSEHYPLVQMLGAAFHGNESRILAWSDDGAIRLWSLITDDEIIRERRHTGLENVVTNQAESSVLSWDREGRLRLWDISYDKHVTSEIIPNHLRENTGTQISITHELELTENNN